MEENDATSTRAAAFSCLAVSALARNLRSSDRRFGSWLTIPEQFLAKSLCAGMLVGAGVAVAAIRWRPRRPGWMTTTGSVILAAMSTLCASVLSGFAVYGVAGWPWRMRF